MKTIPYPQLPHRYPQSRAFVAFQDPLRVRPADLRSSLSPTAPQDLPSTATHEPGIGCGLAARVLSFLIDPYERRSVAPRSGMDAATSRNGVLNSPQFRTDRSKQARIADGAADLVDPRPERAVAQENQLPLVTTRRDTLEEPPSFHRLSTRTLDVRRRSDNTLTDVLAARSSWGYRKRPSP